MRCFVWTDNTDEAPEIRRQPVRSGVIPEPSRAHKAIQEEHKTNMVLTYVECEYR